MSWRNPRGKDFDQGQILCQKVDQVKLVWVRRVRIAGHRKRAAPAAPPCQDELGYFPASDTAAPKVMAVCLPPKSISLMLWLSLFITT